MYILGSAAKLQISSTFRRLSGVSRPVLSRKFSVNSTPSVSAQEKIPKSCDAVIVGGGSLGCSTLYHLNKLGVKNVVLLEKNQLTSGTTWHTAGLVWSLRPSDIDIQLLQITRNMLDRLEEETGINPGWNVNGGLFLASTKERLDEYKRLHTIGKAFGISSEVLSPADTKKRFPLLDETTLYGTIFSSKDGNVDPTGLCNALTRFATNNGGKVLQNCKVTGIRTEDTDFKRRVVKGVDSELGFIETPIVVNCGGAWSTKLCNELGIQIPLIPMKHSYVVFDKIDEVRTMPNLRDHDEGVYFRIQADTLSVGGYEINPSILDTVEDISPFGLFELDWDIFGRNVTGAIKRIPKLKSIGIKSTICGPESFTPDHKPIMGEDPNVTGFFHGYGFNSAGMMFGGGCGSQLAKWITTGHPDLDMFGYDIRRFSPKVCKNKEWAKERSHEAYAKNYSIVYKHDEPLGGRNQLLSPLHHVLAENGCMFQERQGWERAGYFAGKDVNVRLPKNYDWYGQYGCPPNENKGYVDKLSEDYTFEFSPIHDIVRKESMACRNNCAIFDMSYFGKFFLTGPDALKAAQYIFTNQMDRPSGTVVYTCFLNKNGGTEADLTVTALDNSHRLPSDPEFTGRAFYLAVGGTTSNYTYCSIRSLLADNKFNAELVDLSEEYGMMSIQGPKSISIMRELFKDSQFEDNAFPFSTHQIVTLDKVPIRAMRVSFVGELGWELHVPKKHCISVYNEIMRVGDKFGIKNAGYRAIDSLSIEKGYRHWHADLRSDDTPLEAGLGFTCKLKTDVDFLGRQALEQQLKTGLRKKLVCFTLESSPQKALWGLETIWDENTKEPIGYLRRAEYAHYLEKSIGYGYVNCPSQTTNSAEWIKGLENGNYSIEIMGEKVPAKIHLKSPFDPKNLRVKGIYN